MIQRVWCTETTMADTSGEQHFGNMVWNMGKMMDQFQKGFFNFCPSETWTPQVNVYENDVSYIVVVDLAGVDKEKIDHGTFCREVELPNDVDQDQIAASYQNGLLWVELPKR